MFTIKKSIFRISYLGLHVNFQKLKNFLPFVSTTCFPVSFKTNPLVSKRKNDRVIPKKGINPVFVPVLGRNQRSGWQTSGSFRNPFQGGGKIKKTRALSLNSLQTINSLAPILQTEYSLNNYHRSNQDTCLINKPAVFEGQWVEGGDLLADCSSSIGGELSLGHNILIAYLPWEGYNFEDAILISERLVFDDLYTSIHIEKYDLEIRETKFGLEKITCQIPDIPINSLKHLHSSGIAKIGSWVEEGDILVGKTTPVNKKKQSAYQQLLHTILDLPVSPVRDTSFRAPKGIKAKIIGIQLFRNTKLYLNNPSSESKIKDASLQKKIFLNIKKQITGSILRRRDEDSDSKAQQDLLRPDQKTLSKVKNLKNSLKFSLNKNKVFLSYSNQPIINTEKNVKDINSTVASFQSLVSRDWNEHIPFGSSFVPNQGEKTAITSTPFFKSYNFKKYFNFSSIPILNRIKTFSNLITASSFKTNSPEKNRFIPFLRTTTLKRLRTEGKIQKKRVDIEKTKLKKREIRVNKLQKENNLVNKTFLGNISSIQIYLAEKRRTQVGDKMAGRHGNKGIISQILPIEDMPFLPDGSPLDMVLNPLGVPSRMNVGQIYECLLGLAGRYLGEKYKIIPFDEIYGPEASRSFVYSKLNEALIKTGKNWIFNPNSPGKLRLYDRRTGDTFNQTVTVGYAYMLRLVHMVDDKIHARSTGPYSLITQQPLRGRSKVGGQRLGEMEVWALEGYGAAFTLLEMLTIKSDDMTNRMTLWSNLILNKELSMGTPESFKVLICELQALCLDIGLFPRAKSPWK